MSNTATLLPRVPTLFEVKGREPLQDKHTEIFMKCTMMDMEKQPDELDKKTVERVKDAGLMIILQRLNWGKSKASTACVLLCSILSEGHPGNMVMWAYTINAIYHKTGEMVTTHTLVDYFKYGFPSENAKKAAWGLQKGYTHDLPVDNLLDQPEIWKAERFTDAKTDS